MELRPPAHPPPKFEHCYQYKLWAYESKASKRERSANRHSSVSRLTKTKEDVDDSEEACTEYDILLVICFIRANSRYPSVAILLRISGERGGNTGINRPRTFDPYATACRQKFAGHDCGEGTQSIEIRSDLNEKKSEEGGDLRANALPFFSYFFLSVQRLVVRYLKWAA